MATHLHVPVRLLSTPIDPSSPNLILHILLTGLHTFSYSTSVESFFLLTLTLFVFGDQFLINNSGDLTKGLLLRGILVTGSSRVNVLFYCDNATYSFYYGMLGE